MMITGIVSSNSSSTAPATPNDTARTATSSFESSFDSNSSSHALHCVRLSKTLTFGNWQSPGGSTTQAD